MADNSRSFAPGTLDHTRQNIGPIDPKEALEMQKKLGGEILPERAAPVNEDSLPHNRAARRRVVRASGKSSSDVAAQSGQANLPTSKQSASTSQIVNRGANGKLVKSDDDLQPMTAQDLKKIDALMMDDEYGIKPDHGMLNFLFRMSAKNRNKVSKDFVDFRLKKNVEHMQAFISTIKTLIQISPDTYKSRIATDTELKFKFLRTVGKWTMHDIKLMVTNISEIGDNITVATLVPIVSSIYHAILTIHYIGEQQIVAIIKELYSDMVQYPKMDKNNMQILAKQAITEWLYISDQIIKGLYPLLMRMCATEYVEYPEFFTAQAPQILKFVGLTKFDLLMPEKKKPKEDEENAEGEKKEEEEKKPAYHIAGQKDALVNSGLKMLDQFFPEAGFLMLDGHPDMYGYFQPLYRFDDGFNVLSPRNGLQVAVVLMKIIEDLFQGCRNISFSFKDDQDLSDMDDNLSSIFSDWSYYREDLFNKKYGDYLRQLVNTTYSQKDYPSSQYGLEAINNMLWRAKYYFFPTYKFSAPVLTKPANDSKYKPIYARTDYLKTVLSILAQRIDEAQPSKGNVLGIQNPWDRYIFEIPNIISKRLDVLLGAKKDDSVTQATNANLIKYTLCIISVLDWWLNNPTSPAYITDTSEIYRKDPNDGTPEFSATERDDQNQLFANGIKKAMAAKKKA